MFRIVWLFLLSLFFSTLNQVYSHDTRFDLLNQPVNASNFVSYVAICAVLKNEKEEDIREWIEYHSRMGVGTFYLHDNGDVPVAPMVDDYVKQGLVTVAERKDVAPQLSIYHRCIRNYRNYHRWIAFIDIDEFMVTKDSCSVPSVMKKYEGYGGVVMLWRMFGSSGHKTRPPGGTLANYWSCADYGHFKTIANTDYAVSHFGNPHLCHYSHGKYSIDTNFWKVSTPNYDPHPTLYEIIYLHHYHLKSKEDYDRNRKRGRASTTEPGRKDERYFQVKDALCSRNCTVLQMPKEMAPECPLSRFASIQPPVNGRVIIHKKLW